ncbi:MAG: PspC domain-containing protein [Jiangellaceae bacterium]|nr:PspC domain-containing protein [Jiangellaceae bacterium]
MSQSDIPRVGTTEPRRGSQWRTLRRSRSDRYVAGVLGGLARRLDVDPLLLRITTVVLAFFGVGLTLYAVGWLLIPAEDDEHSVAEQALGRGPGGPRADAVALATVLGLFVLVSAGGIFAGWGEGTVLLVLAVCGIALLLRQDDQPARTGSNSAAAGTATPTPVADAGQPRSWSEGPDWEQPQSWANDAWEPAAGSTPAPVPRSWLGPITVSVAAVVLGIIAINDVIWAAVEPATYIATALGIVGLGLLVGAWLGRARGLIVLGIVLGVALIPAALASTVDFERAEILRAPTTADAIPTGTQHYGAGSVHFDLSGVDFADVEAVSLTVDQGAGELVVVVPPDVDVTVAAEVGVGEITALGRHAGGFGEELRTTDDGVDGAGGGELRLNLDLGMGRIEVDRAAA